MKSVQLSTRLMGYAAGATAIASAANGAIVHTTVNDTFSSAPTSAGTSESASANMDGTGLTEYMLLPGTQEINGTQYQYVDLKRGDSSDTNAATGAFVIDAGDNRIAALAAGTTIDASSSFSVEGSSASKRNLYDERGSKGDASGPPVGHFSADTVVGNTQYIGVRFQANGDTSGPMLYGWIAVDFTSVHSGSTNLGGIVTDFAYESTGAPIVAGDVGVPEPASLGLLAMGATAMLRRRR